MCQIHGEDVDILAANGLKNSSKEWLMCGSGRLERKPGRGWWWKMPEMEDDIHTARSRLHTRGGHQRGPMKRSRCDICLYTVKNAFKLLGWETVCKQDDTMNPASWSRSPHNWDCGQSIRVIKKYLQHSIPLVNNFYNSTWVQRTVPRRPELEPARSTTLRSWQPTVRHHR